MAIATISGSRLLDRLVKESEEADHRTWVKSHGALGSPAPVVSTPTGKSLLADSDWSTVKKHKPADWTGDAVTPGKWVTETKAAPLSREVATRKSRLYASCVEVRKREPQFQLRAFQTGAMTLSEWMHIGSLEEGVSEALFKSEFKRGRFEDSLVGQRNWKQYINSVVSNWSQQDHEEFVRHLEAKPWLKKAQVEKSDHPTKLDDDLVAFIDGSVEEELAREKGLRGSW